MKRKSLFMRHTTILFLLLAGGISIALFSVKYRVQDLEEMRVALSHEIENEQKSIHILKAEWSYLNNPERIGKLAGRYLGYRPIDSSQMIQPAAIDAIPLRPVQPQPARPAP